MVHGGRVHDARSFPIYIHARRPWRPCRHCIATAFFAATIGWRKNDIKKVFAYSTVRSWLHVRGGGLRRVFGGIYHLMTTRSSRLCCSWVPAA